MRPSEPGFATGTNRLWYAVPLAVGLPLWFLVILPAHDSIVAHQTDVLVALYVLCWIVPVYGFLAYAGWYISSWFIGSSLADLGFRPFACKYLWLLVPYFVSIVLVQWANSAFLLVLHLPVHDRESLLTSYHGMPYSTAMMVFCLCLVAPLSEEVAFCGCLFPLLLHWCWRSRRFSEIAAVLVSSLVFALAHWDLPGLLSYLAPGVCCALLVRQTRSLWPAILLHAAWNSLFVLLVLLH